MRLEAGIFRVLALATPSTMSRCLTYHICIQFFRVRRFPLVRNCQSECWGPKRIDSTTVLPKASRTLGKNIHGGTINSTQIGGLLSLPVKER